MAEGVLIDRPPTSILSTGPNGRSAKAGPAVIAIGRPPPTRDRDRPFRATKPGKFRKRTHAAAAAWALQRPEAMPSLSQSESSVVVSLNELMSLEDRRVRDEAAARARALEAAEVEARAVAERERDERDRARAAAEADAREATRQRARQLAEEDARLEVAKIEAAARARLMEEDAARAHELDRIRAASAAGNRRREFTLGAALALMTLVSVVLGVSMLRSARSLESAAAALARSDAALTELRARGERSELLELDRRQAALNAAPPFDAALEERLVTAAREAAANARRAVDDKSIDAAKVRAFRASLDALATRKAIADQVTLLDDRADLVRREFARAPGSGPALTSLRRAADKAHDLDATRADIDAYRHALDAAAATSAPLAVKTVTSPDSSHRPSRPHCANEHDPLCDLDGRSM